MALSGLLFLWPVIGSLLWDVHSVYDLTVLAVVSVVLLSAVD